MYCRLAYDASSQLVARGFASQFESDAVDIALWMPLNVAPGVLINAKNATSMTVATARYIVSNVVAQFCALVRQEQDAMTWTLSHGERCHHKCIYIRLLTKSIRHDGEITK
jgi:hypothetical protein